MRSLTRLGLTLLLVCTMLGIISCGRDASESPADVADMVDIEALMDEGDYSSAVNLLEERLAIDSEDADAHFQLALAYFNLMQPEGAREHFMRALELDSSRAPAAHHNLGVLAFSQGNISEAQQEFEAALALDPEDPDSHYQLGATYLVQAVPVDSTELIPEFLEKAIEEFQVSLELEPGKAEPLVGLGNIYFLQGDYPNAISMLEQALVSNPEMREALFALGRTYYQVGDFDNAIVTLNKFLETNPPLEYAQQAQAILAEISD